MLGIYLQFCVPLKNTISRSMFTLNCKGKIVSLQTPLVMGIINATPDSFYQVKKTHDIHNVYTLAHSMVDDGADILDVGGQSTRPGSTRVSADEEINRVIPVIERLHAQYPQVLISVDTYHAEVAAKAVEAGASIVNDVSGGELDDRMIATVAFLGVPYICMHMQGRPETMQDKPFYKDVVQELIRFFVGKADACLQAGIKDLIIDPGFGFGKTAIHNFTLLKNLSAFKIFERPILAGLSRKGTIYKTLGIPVEESLNGSTVMHTLAIQNGANIIRVHDVKEAKEVITLMTAYKKAAPDYGAALKI